MNLRDKLRAVDASPQKIPVAAPQKVYTDCWERREVRPLTDFPDAFALNRDTVMLMQRETLPDPLDPRRILYLDTETTGLAGTGTVAFLVGLGRLTKEGFVIRQLLMRDYPEEKFLLRHVAEMAEDCDVLCTFNGRTFDVPLLHDRFLMNRMMPDCLDIPHIDLLHIARRVWKLRLKRCNLGHLEEAVLGIPRTGDLPGSEVPARFFSYLKTGNFHLLDDVLTHNAQDIATLCTLLSHMTQMYEHPEKQRHSEDLFSMGTTLEKMKHPEEARKCYRLASAGAMRVPGQLRLAQSYRRCGAREEALAVWRGMIARHEGGVTPYVELAKHYEHTLRDYDAALDLVRRAMILLAEPTLLDFEGVQSEQNALQYRYDRLKRKRQAKEQ